MVDFGAAISVVRSSGVLWFSRSPAFLLMLSRASRCQAMRANVDRVGPGQSHPPEYPLELDQEATYETRQLWHACIAPSRHCLLSFPTAGETFPCQYGRHIPSLPSW